MHKGHITLFFLECGLVRRARLLQRKGRSSNVKKYPDIEITHHVRQMSVEDMFEYRALELKGNPTPFKRARGLDL
jgi:hypothetical protein